MAAAAADRSTGRNGREQAVVKLRPKAVRRKSPRPRKAWQRKRNFRINTESENVSTAESLQKRGERRFPLRESGGGAPYCYRDEAREEIARRTDRLHCD